MRGARVTVLLRIMFSFLFSVGILSARGGEDSGPALPEHVGKELSELPKLQVDSPSFDAGRQLIYRPYSHIFQFTNSGNAPLSVNVATRSCGCIGGELSGNVIPPGGTGSLTLSIAAKEGQAESEDYKVALATNDAKQPEVLLQLKLRWADQVSASPSSLEFHPTSGSAPAKPIFDVICLKDERLPKIQSIESSSPLVSVKKVSEEAIAGGTKTSYSAELSAGSGVDDAAKLKVIVKTDSERIPRFEIPARWVSAPKLTLTPQIVSFGVVKGTESLHATARVEQKDDGGAEIVSASCTDARVTARLEPVRDRRGAWDLRVSLKPGLPNGRVKTAIDLLAKDGTKVGEVPVYAVIAPEKN